MKKRQYRPMTKVLPMDSLDIAWLAGIVEGEGCFNGPENSSGSFKLRVQMSDKDIIDRLQQITGVGTIKPKKSKEGLRQNWTWGVYTTADTVRLACAMAPLLGERRRAKIMELIEKL